MLRKRNETLTQTINRSKVDASTAKVVQRICRADLIIVDDIGILPAGQAEAEALYRIADAAYERGSLAVTSNIHPSGFDTLMPKAPVPPWIGCFTTVMLWTPKVVPSASPRL